MRVAALLEDARGHGVGYRIRKLQNPRRTAHGRQHGPVGRAGLVPDETGPEREPMVELVEGRCRGLVVLRGREVTIAQVDESRDLSAVSSRIHSSRRASWAPSDVDARLPD